MTSHDVRRLRVCNKCNELRYKESMVRKLCISCAFQAAGSLDTFMHKYPKNEWHKLTLNVVGMDNMKRLIRLLEKDGQS